MKNLFLSILLSFGVGLTMMGSPAQVCGDDNAQGHGYTVRNTKCVEMKKLPLPSCIKQEIKVKKIEERMKTSVLKLPMNKLENQPKPSVSSRPTIATIAKIGSDPVPKPKDPKDPKQNSEPPLLLDR